MCANREYKDSVFTTLFNDTDNLLSLYNAVTGNALPPGTQMKIATLEDVLFDGRRNDIAFVVEGKLVILIEHQSTINENMPLRLLIYLARVYEKLIYNDAVYRRTLLKIPKPDFIVLYNGEDQFPDERTLRLSDAYEEYHEAFSELGGSLELEVRVVNINEGRNEAVVNKSEALRGYVAFIGKVRANIASGIDLTQAVTQAVKDCIGEGILEEFLNNHSSEVINMLTTEWNIERAKVVWEQEGIEKGLEEGMKKGVKRGIKKTQRQIVLEMKKEGFSDDMISKITKLPVESICKIYSKS